MTDVAVRVDGIAKIYEIGSLQTTHDTLRDQVGATAKSVLRHLHPAGRRANAEQREIDTVWALEDISFDVERGSVVGIIGRNGAGKSTLLKVLSQITEPTRGYAEIHGRVGSLLEVGTGFHPELTGRENIALNGAILGMRRREIQEKFDEIVAFAEVERFIDTPVKRYSSGMYMRLAFSVAAHLDTEVLLVDEVLAVGDTAFQAKCLGKMGEVARAGRTVLFVSHNMGAIAELCSRAILLEGGRVVVDAPVAEALEAYSRRMTPHRGDEASSTFEPDPTSPCSILSVSIADRHGHTKSHFDLDEDLVIALTYEVTQPTADLLLNVTLSRNMVDIVNTFDTDDQPQIAPKEPGRFTARHTMPAAFLKAGIYTISVGSGTPSEAFQVFDDVVLFEIEELGENTQLRGYRRDRRGHVISPGTWETERA